MRCITINIDLYASAVLPIRMKQGDDTTLTMNIFARGVAYDVIGCTFAMLYTLPSGDTVVQSTDITADSNTLTIIVSPAVVAVSGNVQCELRIYPSAGQISTYIFGASVAPALLTDQTVDGETADTIAGALIASTRAPYIGENGNWFVFDNTTGEFVDSGVGAASQNTDYNIMTNKPSIENTVLIGNKTLSEIGADRLTNSDIETLLSQIFI